MTRVTPIPTNLLKLVARFPGLTASGYSQILGKRSDGCSGSLCRLAKQGRIRREWQKGMRKNFAWRYYPVE